MDPDEVQRAIQRVRAGALAEDHLGPPPDYAIDVHRAQLRRDRFIQGILDEVGVGGDDQERCQQAIRTALSGSDFFDLYPEVEQTLRLLEARGLRLGIISNWDPRLHELCTNLGIVQHFQFVLASEAEGFAKPGPVLFRRALERAGVSPDRAVHVGDSYEHDVVGARQVGIQAILLDRSGSYAAGTWNPVIQSLSELLSLIDS